MAEKQQGIVVGEPIPDAVALSGTGSFRVFDGTISVPAPVISAGCLFSVSGNTFSYYTLLEDALRANTRLVLSIAGDTVKTVSRFSEPRVHLRRNPSFRRLNAVSRPVFAGGLRL